jgi:hypothetical protein
MHGLSLLPERLLHTHDDLLHQGHEAVLTDRRQDADVEVGNVPHYRNLFGNITHAPTSHEQRQNLSVAPLAASSLCRSGGDEFHIGQADFVLAEMGLQRCCKRFKRRPPAWVAAAVCE